MFRIIYYSGPAWRIFFIFIIISHHSNLNKRERKKSTKSQPMRNLNRSRKLPQCVLLVKKKRMNYMLIILSVIETSLKYLISIKKSTLFKVTITVNLLGQYVLSDLCLVVHLFSKRALRACTSWRSPSRCMLAE